MESAVARQALNLALEEAHRLHASLDLGFFGGEPLLEWKLLRECDDYLRSRAQELPAPPRFTLTTNGTLLTPARAAWLAEKRYMVVLSLDGSAAMHNINRVYPDGRGSHAAAATALHLLSHTPGMLYQTACVLTANNYRYAAEGMAWLNAHRPGTIMLNVDYWTPWSKADLQGAEEQLARCGDLILQSFREGHPILAEPFLSKMALLLRGGQRPCDRCRMGERELCVSVDGGLFPCSRLVGSAENPALSLGNVTHGIDRNNQTALLLRRRQIPDRCAACAERPFCIYHCGCTNYAATGDVARVGETTCRTEQCFIAHARRITKLLRAERNPAFFAIFGHLIP